MLLPLVASTSNTPSEISRMETSNVPPPRVVDHDLAVFFFLVKPVRERRRRRLVDDTQHVEPCDLARVLGRLTLRIRKVRGAGDDGVRHLAAEVRLRVRLQLGKDHGGDLLRRIGLVVDLHLLIRTHVTFDGNHRLVGIGDRLVLCHLPDDTRAVLLKRDDGRRRARNPLRWE